MDIAKQVVPFLLVIMVVNLMIFATPRLISVDYQEKSVQHTAEFATHASTATTDQVICTAHMTVIKCTDINEKVFFSVDIALDVVIYQVEVNPLLILSANTTSVFIFYMTGGSNGYNYYLGLVTADGLQESWLVQHFQTTASNGFSDDVYRVNLKQINQQLLLTLHIISAGMTKSGTSLNCQGYVYRLQNNQLQQLYNESLGSGGCALTPYPTSFVYDNDLIIPFKTVRQDYIRYDPSSGQFSSFNQITEQIKQRTEDSNLYQFLGYFVYHDLLHYVWGYNIRKIAADNGENYIQIFNADGLQAELSLQDFLPASILANKANQQYFLTFLQATSSQLYDSINPSIDRQLATINIGRNTKGFVLNLRTIDFQGSFLFKFNPTTRDKLTAEITYQFDGGEEIYNLISIANIQSSILFEYQIYIDAPEFPFSYQLNWTGVEPANFAAQVEMTRPLLKYGLTNLIMALTTIIVVYLKRPRILLSDQLYPKSLD